MAPAMKLVIKYEEGEDTALHTTLKLTLPRKWKEGGTLKLKETFVEHFNGKHPDNLLDLGKVHLLNMAGHALADDDIVVQVLESGEHVRVKPGAPPEKIHRRNPSGTGGKTATVKKPLSAMPTPQPIGNSEKVTSAAAMDAARQTSHAFDYSKWDRLDLSDEDGDNVHPNIDKESWKRLMAQKRKDRREKEEEKIEAFKGKIEKYTTKAKEIQQQIDDGNDDAQLIVDLKDAQESAEKYQSKLDHFLSTRKLTADDVCDVSEDHTALSKNAGITPAGVTFPTPTSSASPTKPDKPRDESMEYDHYIKEYGELADTYAALRSDEASEKYLFQHPELLSEHCEGYLLLLTLDTCMQHLEEKDDLGEKFTTKHEAQWKEKELAIARQHLLIQFVLTLSKSKGCDPRDMIRPFFAKTSKHSAQRVEGFEDDLMAFVTRIRNRAIEKRANDEPSPLLNRRLQQNEEEKYERAGVGPGGLDPNEVLPTLPEDMQTAFIEQDTELLKKTLESLPYEEAQLHLKRCIDSGLWVPGGGAAEPDDDEEEEADDEANE